MMLMTATDAINRLLEHASPEKAASMQKFFKTGKGEYAEGDIFLGLSNSAVRTVTKEYALLPLDEVQKLLKDVRHEVRCCALLILVEQFRKGDDARRDAILSVFSDAAPKYINNWDLVDLSAPGIVGMYELNHHSNVIERFSESNVLWVQRISIVSTLTLIRHGKFHLTLQLCEKFLTHPHDLIHKACGWMLREVGKRDRSLLTAFLTKYHFSMPRTMLRHAIEHYPEAERKNFLKK